VLNCELRQLSDGIRANSVSWAIIDRQSAIKGAKAYTRTGTKKHDIEKYIPERGTFNMKKMKTNLKWAAFLLVTQTLYSFFL